MPTVSVNLDQTQYVKVNTALNPMVLQAPRDTVRITLSALKPSLGNTVYHSLGGQDDPLKFDSIDTNVWALAMTNRSSLIVSESPAIHIDPHISYALNNIHGDYGDIASVAQKNKKLLKFGRNHAVGASRTTIMSLPAGVANEVYVDDNLIDTVSSDNVADTRVITIEGHTIDAGDLTFVVQNATLNGQNKVVLTTPLARMTRIYAADGDTTELVGVIYGYEDTAIVAGAPTDGSKVHCMIEAGEQQSHKASTSISANDYWLIDTFDADCYEKSAGFAEVRLETRRLTGVWREIETVAVSAGNHAEHQFHPFTIIPPNSDVRLTAIADGANTDVGGMIEGYLAAIIG